MTLISQFYPLCWNTTNFTHPVQSAGHGSFFFLSKAVETRLYKFFCELYCNTTHMCLQINACAIWQVLCYVWASTNQIYMIVFLCILTEQVERSNQGSILNEELPCVQTVVPKRFWCTCCGGQRSCDHFYPFFCFSVLLHVHVHLYFVSLRPP